MLNSMNFELVRVTDGDTSGVSDTIPRNQGTTTRVAKARCAVPNTADAKQNVMMPIENLPQNTPMSCRYISACQSCHFFTSSSYLSCAIHPEGVMGDRCLDWRPIPQNDEDIRFYSPDEQWEPEGASYYNGELILPPRRHLSPLEQEYLLDTHPLFTGHCPQCGAAMPMTDPPPLHWDCDRCGWKDDSI